MSFARLVLATSSLEKMPSNVHYTLPPRHAIMHLINHYLDNIYVLYPFFPETKLFVSLDLIYQEGGCHADAIDHWHVRLVLAIALASLSRRRGDEHHRDAMSHAATAFNWAEIVLQPGSLVGIQAILLLVLYATLDPHHFNSWYLIEVASRVMIDLGLHQDSADMSFMRDSDIQMRHRIYQSVYTLDRFGEMPIFVPLAQLTHFQSDKHDLSQSILVHRRFYQRRFPLGPKTLFNGVDRPARSAISPSA